MNAAALHTAEILVRFANPADGTRKPSIKASDGTYYGVKPVDFGRFQEGGRYRIEFTQRDYKGRTYRDIVKCEPIRSVQPAASGDAAGTRAPSPRGSPTGGEGVTASEIGFVTRMLAARVASCGVEWSGDTLAKEARFLRELYGRIFVA